MEVQRMNEVYERARRRVQDTPQLAEHEAFILAYWPEGDDHWQWVATAPVAEVVSWAEAGSAATEHTGIFIVENCVAVESQKAAECSVCGRDGIRSSWPEDDPENSGALYLVLCHDEHGDLMCDDCSARRAGRVDVGVSAKAARRQQEGGLRRRA